jgi:inosine-uridine nucleoside N-ribohydrolase
MKGFFFSKKLTYEPHQVFHSGIPITLVPLDATNTIPINKEFFYEFERHQSTYEAQYCFKSLKMARDTWFNDEFYTVSSCNLFHLI